MSELDKLKFHLRSTVIWDVTPLVRQKFADVSVESTTFIFRAEKQANQGVRNQRCRSTEVLHSSEARTKPRNKGAASYSETSGNVHRLIPRNGTVHGHGYKYLKYNRNLSHSIASPFNLLNIKRWQQSIADAVTQRIFKLNYNRDNDLIKSQLPY